MKFDIKSDPSIIVNPWIEIPNVVTEKDVGDLTRHPSFFGGVQWKFDELRKA